MNELGGQIVALLAGALPYVLAVLGIVLVIALLDGRRSRRRHSGDGDDPAPH